MCALIMSWYMCCSVWRYSAIVCISATAVIIIVLSDLPVNLLSSLNDQIMSSPMQSVLENLSFHIVMLETAALYPQLSPLVCEISLCKHINVFV